MRRLPTMGGQPVLPLRVVVAVIFGVAMGILATWWWGLILFAAGYMALAFVDYRVQRWKLAHYEETGYWPWERWPWQRG